MVDERQEELTSGETQLSPDPSESSKITTEAIDGFAKSARARLDPLLGSVAAICTGTALTSLLTSGDFQVFFQYWLMSSVLMFLSDLDKNIREKKGQLTKAVQEEAQE